jgi:hypothetical protein
VPPTPKATAAVAASPGGQYQQDVIDWYANLAWKDTDNVNAALAKWQQSPAYHGSSQDFKSTVNQQILKGKSGAAPANVDQPGQSQMTPAQGQAWVDAFQNQPNPAVEGAKQFLLDKLGYVPAGEPLAWAKKYGLTSPETYKAGMTKGAQPATNPLQQYWGKKPTEVPLYIWNQATLAQKIELAAKATGSTSPLAANPAKADWQREKDRIKGKFTTPAYHGQTSQEDQGFRLYNEPKSPTGKKRFAAAQPELSKLYAPGDVSKYWLNTNDYHMFNAQGKSWGDIGKKAIDEAAKAGKKGIIVHNVADEPNLGMSKLGPQTTYVIFDQSTVRSEKAQFDPAKWHLPDILASGAGIAVAGSLTGDKAEAAPLPRTLKLYHASPADFEKFDLSKAGTGVGRSEFSRGVYVAENPDVMEHYARRFQNERGKAVRYNLEANVDQSQIVDFDKPFAQQSPEVQAALQKIGVTDLDERRANALANIGDPNVSYLSPEEVTKLRAEGVQGLQFFDQKSRAAGAGTRNYVMYDPATLSIINKYGLAGLITGGAALAGGEEARAEGLPPGAVPIDLPPGAVPTGLSTGLPPGAVPIEEPETLGGSVAQEFGKGLSAVRGAHDQETQRRLGILPSHGGARDFAGEFLQIAGGLGGMATAPITGAVRHYGAPLAGSLPAQPEGERPGLFQPFKNPIAGASERARQSAARPFGAQGTREEQMERMTDTLSAFVPGMGLVGGPKALYQAAGKVAGKIGSSPVARTFEQIFSPTTVDANSKIAEAIIRGTGGRAARDTSQAAAVMEPFHKTINQLPEPARLDFIDHVEGGPAKIATLPPPLQTLATAMRDAFEQRKAKLQSLPETSNMAFIDDYFPHMWQDPGAATTFAEAFKSGGAGKQGSAASLHKRTVPTVADGLKAGLVPISTDPIEMTMRYVTSMDRFIASTSSLEIAKRVGQARYIRPRVMGASGHPDSFKVPDGWVPLNGRGSRNAQGAQAYAPEGFARVYNNFIDRGVHELGPEFGRVYDALQRTSNAITGLELGLSGFHAVTMVKEAYVSRLATGLKQIGSGAATGDAMQILRGFGKAATSPGAFVGSALKGLQMQKVYLGQTPGAPDMARIVNLLEKGGGRAIGARHATDYRFSAQGSYWKAWRQGALKMQMATAAADIKAHPIVGTARQAASAIGRVMSTVAAPLFESYIPRLKNGAFYDAMSAWLHANPLATYKDQVAQARQIWDSIDNRFGELVDDNIFWNQTMKQAAKLGMRSYSWNLGTVREIGGGVADIARGDFSDRAAYVVALPMAMATINAFYQALKGQGPPQSVEDLVGARTGGEQTISIPSTQPYRRSAKSTVPERVQIPGYEKDVMGWYENWQQEALNKRSKMVSMAGELAFNQNWRGDPIFNPEDSAPQWLQQALKYMVDSFTPISLQGAVKGRKEGSALTFPEQMGGLKPAPAYVSDPEGYARQQHNLNVLRQKKKGAFERRQQQQYGGTE